MVTSTQVPVTHVGAGAELAESVLAAGQSPGFNQFPSGGTNLPVWMAAGNDGLGVSTGGLGGVGNGLFTASSNTGQDENI